MIYNLLLLLLLPLFYVHRWFRHFRHFTHQSAPAAKQPLGHNKPTPAEHDLWLHGASVGELNLTLLLAVELLKQSPTLKLLITANTATAMARARPLIKHYASTHKLPNLAQQITLSYAPYDLPFIINRFLSKFSPRLLVTMEAEIWRNLSIAAHKRQIPIILANARLTNRSLNTRIKYHFAMPPAACLPQVIAAQSAADAANFHKWYLAVGAAAPQTHIFGNMKFDLVTNNLANNLASQLNNSNENLSKLQKLLDSGNSISESDGKLGENSGTKVIWCAASTHHPEEDYLITTVKELASTQQDNLLILAPRHPHRFNQVASKLGKSGINFIRYSDLVANNFNATASDFATCQVLLLDTLGDLPQVYPLTSFAFVGGSFTERGGQNILEPLMAGAAVILGPKHHNLTEILRCFRNTGEKKTLNNIGQGTGINTGEGTGINTGVQGGELYPDYLSIVQDQQQLTQRVSNFIKQAATANKSPNQASKHTQLAAAAPAVIAAHKGTTKNTASLIATYR